MRETRQASIAEGQCVIEVSYHLGHLRHGLVGLFRVSPASSIIGCYYHLRIGSGHAGARSGENGLASIGQGLAAAREFRPG